MEDPSNADSIAHPPCGAVHPQTDVMRKTGLIIKPCARHAGHKGFGEKSVNSFGQGGHVFHVEQIDAEGVS